MKVEVISGTTALAVDEQQPVDLDPGCQLCPLQHKVRSPCLAADGEPGGLLVLGEFPSEVEDRQGRPFASASGAYVRELINRWWHGPVVFDNGIRCAPGARKVLPTAISACRGYTAAVLRDARPSRVVAVGPTAVASLVGRSFALLSVRKGWARMASGVPVFFVLPTWQVMRNRYLRAWFEEDMEWALTADVPLLADVTVNILESVQESADACLELALEEWFAFDYETFGRRHDDEFRAITLAATPGSNTDSAFVWPDELLNEPAVIAQLARLMSDPTVAKGAQNVKFDAGVCRKIGAPVDRLCFDTQLWRKMLEADALASLEQQQALVGRGGGKDEAKQWVAAAAREWGKFIKKPSAQPEVLKFVPQDVRIKVAQRIAAHADPKVYSYIGIPPEVRHCYAAMDAVTCAKLKERHEPAIRAEPGLSMVWDGVVEDLIGAVVSMESNGVLVDPAAVRALQEQCQEQIDEVAEVIELYGLENPNSADQVARVLFDELKLPSAKTTAGGKRTTSAEVLEKLRHPLSAAILKFRKASKFKSQYANSMLEFVQDDGRVHPSLKIDGTETGRLSCEEPNLFNIPRAETPMGKMCRDCFVAPPGFMLLEADYSQIELRVAAMLSGDEVMLDFFRRGVDFHLATAKLIAPLFGLNPDDIDKEHWLRSSAKTINFGVLYGKDEHGLGAELGIGKVRAKQLIDAIFGQFKKLKVWITRQLAESRKTGSVRTWWDGKPARVRPLWRLGDPDEEERATAERATWNTPIQGTATEFTNASLGKIDREIRAGVIQARLVLTVYDSIILEVAEPDVRVVGGQVKRIMESWNSGSVPVISELKVGKAWGSLSKVEVAA